MELPPSMINLINESILAKRLDVYKDFNEVPYIENDIGYWDFFENYLIPNKLCVIGPWLTKNWLSRKKWVNKDGTPNVEYLNQQFGDARCPIANCKKEECGSHVKTDMTFSEFMDYMQCYKESNYSEEMDCLYLKDWHLVRHFPDYQAYSTPVYFSSDWLNEFWDERSDNECDDYRFVYIGPKGTWTPFHSDVQRSYSWSANICGKKKWIFFPPDEEEYLKDIHDNLPYDLRSPELNNTKQYPNIHKVTKRIEVIQEEGEVVFVPSGWHHQVFNLEDTISINHNWINGCNIDICWKFLQTSLYEVKQEIKDCCDMEGWEEQCQLILKSTSGIDYKEFYNFIKLIGTNRMYSLGSNSSLVEKIETLIKSKSKTNTQEISTKVKTAVEEVVTFVMSKFSVTYEVEPPVMLETCHRFPIFSSATPVVLQSVSIYSKVEHHLRWDIIRCQELYGWHFPELKYVIKDPVTYAKVVKTMGNRSNANTTDFTDLLSTTLAKDIQYAANVSMGIQKITSKELDKIFSFCEKVILTDIYRKQLHDYIKGLIQKTGPVLTELTDEIIAAKLLTYAASLYKDQAHIIADHQLDRLEKDIKGLCISEYKSPGGPSKLEVNSDDTGKVEVITDINSKEIEQCCGGSSEQESRFQDCETQRSSCNGSTSGESQKYDELINGVDTKSVNNSLVSNSKTNFSFKNHLIFDLRQVKTVLKALLDDYDFTMLLEADCDNAIDVLDFLEKVNSCLELVMFCNKIE